MLAKLLTSLIVLGTAIFLIASTFFGTGCIPFLLIQYHKVGSEKCFSVEKFEDSLLFWLVGGIGGLIKLVPLVTCMGKCKTTFSECMWGQFV